MTTREFIGEAGGDRGLRPIETAAQQSQRLGANGQGEDGVKVVALLAFVAKQLARTAPHPTAQDGNQREHLSRGRGKSMIRRSGT